MSESIEELEPLDNADAKDIDELESSSVAPVIGSTGQALALARERLGMSVEDVAIRLHLSARQVRALEADDASALPGAMFVRGFIRNYAKLLGLDAEPLLASYQVSTPDSQNRVITLRSANIPIVSGGKKVWMPYAVASALIGLALAIWMVYMDYVVEDKHVTVEKPGVTKSAQPAVPAPEPVPPAVLQAPPALPVGPQTNAIDAAQSPTTVQPQPAAKVPPAVPSPSPSATKTSSAPQEPSNAARLSITCSEHSWISITDHDGHEIFNKNQPAGSQADVTGVPPFNIVVGNVSGVRLTFNDKPIDLATYAKGNVARFTLE